MADTPPSPAVSVKDYDTSGDHVMYKIYVKEENTASYRFSEFEAIGKSVSASGVKVDWSSFPSKITLFSSKNDSFYQNRTGKLEQFLVDLIKQVVVKKNADGQKLVKEFLNLQTQALLPESLEPSTEKQLTQPGTSVIPITQDPSGEPQANGAQNGDQATNPSDKAVAGTPPADLNEPEKESTNPGGDKAPAQSQPDVAAKKRGCCAPFFGSKAKK